MKLPKIGGQSPWGTIQHIKDIGNDCVFVDTPSHGGVFVPDEKLKGIPRRMREYSARWSGSQNWYEEDECAAIPLYYLNLNGFKDEAHRIVLYIENKMNNNVDITPALV